jgi:D-glycero-D-manno-heptose 1,7-bisphosphate phosphatase
VSAPAVFLDRDGTLIHARHYPSRPGDLVLYDGIVAELATLKRGGFKLVLVTNQGGLAYGYFTASDLTRMHDHLQTQLAAAGADFDAIFHCPHHPRGRIPELAIDCDCRKPKPGMLLSAAHELDLDLNRSWMVGDILDDVEAGNRAGCRTILVDLGTEAPPGAPARTPSFVARDSVHALRIIQFLETGGSPADLTYLPAAWAGRFAREGGVPCR